MTTDTAVLDGVCQFFGGPYSAVTHTYATPTVAGLTVVRRALAKRQDIAEYFVGLPKGTATGCVMVVHLPHGSDRRAAMPAVLGRRKSVYDVEAHCFIRSTASYSEDVQDFLYSLRDAIVTKIRTDPTLGSGGFEAGGFQVGEGDEPSIDWDASLTETVNDVTQAYLMIAFQAAAYEVA